MKFKLGAFVAGLLFGAGLAISGLTQPGKVFGFLDVSGAFDPSLLLAFVGGSGDPQAERGGEQAIFSRASPKRRRRSCLRASERWRIRQLDHELAALPSASRFKSDRVRRNSGVRLLAICPDRALLPGLTQRGDRHRPWRLFASSRVAHLRNA